MRGGTNLEGHLVPCAYYGTLKSCNRNGAIVIFVAGFGHEEHEGWYPRTWVLPAPWGGVVLVGHDAPIRSDEGKDNRKDKEKEKTNGKYFLWSVPSGLCRAVMLRFFGGLVWYHVVHVHSVSAECFDYMQGA